MPDLRAVGALSYTNPVYPRSFPDPFVLKFCGEYFAFCTGFAGDGNVFGVLLSTDLVNWHECGGAMKPLESSPPLYWAPEVTYDNGKFYLYYSAGNEILMELRVAVSERPDGGYIDCGRRLTAEDFAIDPHIYVDEDGAKYLFYATDFLEHTHIGTGTVVDRMLDWLTPAGDPRPVTRAMYDWQVYDPERKEKGGVRWHTVEGPSVLKRKDLYYEMFSGGNWQNTTYGVSFAVSDTIRRDDEWQQFSDGERVLPILRTIPGVIIGPGHNCVVRGPNNRELYCVYHRWTGNERVMAIDRMDHAGDRLFISGATHTPQLAPFAATFSEKFRSNVLSKKDLGMAGPWSFGSTGAVVTSTGHRAAIRPRCLPGSFLCEVSWACIDPINPSSELGILFRAGDSEAILSFSLGSNTATLTFRGDTDRHTVSAIPDGFIWSAVHLFRIEADGNRVEVRLDSLPLGFDLSFPHAITAFELFFNDQSVAVRSFELTNGFEELFQHDGTLANGWKMEPGAVAHIRDGEFVTERQKEFSLGRENLSLLDLEFAVNVRMPEQASRAGLILQARGMNVFRMMVDAEKRSVEISDGSTHDLPQSIDLTRYHQLRVVKIGRHAHYFFDDSYLGMAGVADIEAEPRFTAVGTGFAVEMIRVTAI
ncbi:MAG TPA: glycoside hydrolase family 43 protein [Pyrinomonadaceae bacterium]|nr:glycoside hydrolase family 43 protein [Pyrinomonadaceae bacterium]